LTTSRTIVLNVVTGATDNLVGAVTVAGRVAEVARSRGARLEVFIFAAAQRALTDPGKTVFNEGVDTLVSGGVPVSACTNFARKLGAEGALLDRGIRLEPARDAYLRFTLAGATVISL